MTVDDLDAAAQRRPMDRRVCLVTGATGGMGEVVATDLARRGATVLIVARDEAKGEVVRRAIAATTGNGAVDLFVADLAEFSEVRRLAEEVLARYPVLHLLVNNAGAFATAHRLNADGVERNLAVNYFSPVLLTDLVLGALHAGAPARIVNVGSAAMARTLDLADVDTGQRPVGARGYATAKLALLVASLALARRLDGTGVTVNALHPGLAATGIGDAVVPAALRPLVRLAKAAAVRLSLVATPEEGARTTIHLATAPEVAAVTGRYFVNRREHHIPPVAADVDVQEQLWRHTVRILGREPAAAEPDANREAARTSPDPLPSTAGPRTLPA